MASTIRRYSRASVLAGRVRLPTELQLLKGLRYQAIIEQRTGRRTVWKFEFSSRVTRSFLTFAEEWKHMAAETYGLKQELKEAQAQTSALQTEIERLTQDDTISRCRQLKNENRQLRDNNARLKDQIRRLNGPLGSVVVRKAKLEEHHAKAQRIALLRKEHKEGFESRPDLGSMVAGIQSVASIKIPGGNIRWATKRKRRP
jgi:seryl-tRNA synthetase